ncbi:MAG: hypothetical protein M0C28_18000 [Candidatus Moduliflexus flocculans]|nr:hypothetical protein [Candidatus Moduliflexus flocculans]
MTIEKTAFQGWPNCYRVSNGTVEFIATTDVGPRIISFGFIGGANLFFVREDFAGQTGGSEWKNYGGHRVWHAPEDKVRTYEPDNAPCRGAGHRQRAAADHAARAAERDPEGDRDHAGPGLVRGAGDPPPAQHGRLAGRARAVGHQRDGPGRLRHRAAPDRLPPGPAPAEPGRDPLALHRHARRPLAVGHRLHPAAAEGGLQP